MSHFIKHIYRFAIPLIPITLVFIIKPTEGAGRSIGELALPFFLTSWIIFWNGLNLNKIISIKNLVSIIAILLFSFMILSPVVYSAISPVTSDYSGLFIFPFIALVAIFILSFLYTRISSLSKSGNNSIN